MSFDFYTYNDELISDLQKQGLDGWAAKLDHAVAAGATGTEILMTIRWELLQFLKTKPECKGGTLALIDEMLRELDQVLS